MMRVNLYHLKKIIITPYILYMRYKERNSSPEGIGLLEAVNYSPAAYRFIRGFLCNKDILFDAPGLNESSLIFDVGAFQGDWAARMFEKYQARICTFEVEPDFCALLTKRFNMNPKIRCLDFGLGGADANFLLTRGGMATTLYPREGLAADADQIEVPVRDVVDVMNELGASTIDLMKINIEGGEYDLLERMISANRMQDVQCFMVQFHEWIDGAYRRRKKIREALRKTHDLVWDYPFVWEQWVRKER